MRIGDSVEGSLQEIKDLFETFSLNLADFLETPETKLEKRWLISPAVIVAASMVLIVLFGGASQKALVTFLALGFGGGTWLTVSVQIRFKNGLATFAAALGVVLALLVAAGLITAQQAAEVIQKVKPQ